MARWLSAGGRCSWRRLVVCSLTCLLLLQLYSFSNRVSLEVEKMKLLSALHPFPLQEHEQVEGLILLPPFGLKYPHKINLNEEFLNASSTARNIFFPIGAIDPRGDAKNDKHYYRPGKTWLDTDGNPIHAHGEAFCSMRNRTRFIGTESTKTALLITPRKRARLALIRKNETHDLYKMKVLERPKVIHNVRTGKYVMYMHIDDATYNKASVGIATSDSPTGPFEYLYSLRPNKFDSRDMTVFRDDNGTAYLIYSSVRNKEIHISPLSQDYTDVLNETARALVGHHREAPAVFKYRNVYYMVTSGCSGWAPNEALVHEAESIFGPWETIGNPCVGANKDFRAATFFAQSTFVIPMPGAGPGSFIFMADRWNPNDLRDSRYVWLPLTVRQRNERYVGLPLWSRVSIFWHKKWRIPVRENGESNYVIDLQA
ncbi:hypothetical protein DH2020_034356 [Rehmannia glutinosa]|uniref:Uncharacterized protein n=1 Tax=Rehmannia glutinosa TaxID=99300 RepID=A0ABR0VBF2_REHGL